LLLLRRWRERVAAWLSILKEREVLLLRLVGVVCVLGTGFTRARAKTIEGSM
jgi:hypothetical protein